METDACKHAAGLFKPVIDRNRCEGKAACVEVCPYNVFVIETLPKEQRKNLSFVGKLKGFGHKWQQAFTQNADLCHACGLCVTVCPEKAIKLIRS
ncbi:MAG TPA: ferredoxin family protein [Gammaproteobacteria bacterium]|jgi:NAD-dependent dihydropyrimidine dehydrogenase PreA subunit